ncbi:MAG: DUF4238 domain-containing protein [Gemmatimonadota bacterium]|nr:DUF4238 domain-containing protein [Gemmatimonadota bacterium]
MNSGPNQHYIPRFVQKPFGIPPKRNQIWYFERGSSPQERAIKRTGSQSHFYSGAAETGNSTLDDEITKAESQLSSVLRTIRSVPIGDTVEPAGAAAIVAHLAPRTAHLRDSLKHGLAQVVDGAAASFTDTGNVRASVGLDQPIPNDRFREYVLSDLKDLPELSELNLPAHVRERVAFYISKENADEFLDNFTSLFRLVLNGLLSRSDMLVRDSHNKGLKEIFKSNHREIFLRTLDWTIKSAPTVGAILPDCVVIAINKEAEIAPLMLAGHDDISAVVMPVSPGKLLVGITDGCALPRSFNYNAEAARASYSFFLSSRNNAEILSLCPVIAERSIFVLDEEVTSGIQDVFPQSLPSRLEDDLVKPGPTYRPIDPDLSKFQSNPSFDGGEDRKAIQGQIKQLRTIESALSRALPLSRLDGITFVGDLPAVLRNLDRDFDNAPPIESDSREFGMRAAQMLRVVQSGKIKGHILMSSAVARALKSSDGAEKEFGIYTVVRELALVATIEYVEFALPGALLSPIEGELDPWLYRNVDAALHGYVASYIAARYIDEQEMVEAKRHLLADCINRMRIDVLSERLSYRDHGDLEELLNVTLPAIRYVLLFAADLLGHNAVSGRSAFRETDELHNSLEEAGLTNWLEAYRVDLMKFHKQLGRWGSFDEFLSFNVHVERLLWQFGMFPWEKPEGIWVEVR